MTGMQQVAWLENHIEPLVNLQRNPALFQSLEASYIRPASLPGRLDFHMAVPFVSRLFIYTAVAAVIAGAAMAHHPMPAAMAVAHPVTTLS
jgi:hypothetical protein